MTSWRSRVAPWVPPAVSSWAARRSTESNAFREFPGTWAQAVTSVPGYSDEAILAKVAAATRAVERGDAAFERDSVLFSDPEYSWPLLAALLHTAARDGRLSVLDFGGALGSTYRQHRRFLDDLDNVTWTVIEQQGFVELGSREFTTARLSFARTVAEAVSSGSSNVAILGSSLQYMDDPRRVLDEMTSTDVTTLIIDRTPLSDEPDDILCIQTVPATIYAASYPLWILSRSRLIAHLAPQWTPIAQYDAGHGQPKTDTGRSFSWAGLILARR